MSLDDIVKETVAGIALVMLSLFLCGLALLPIAIVWWIVK